MSLFYILCQLVIVIINSHIEVIICNFLNVDDGYEMLRIYIIWHVFPIKNMLNMTSIECYEQA